MRGNRLIRHPSHGELTMESSTPADGIPTVGLVVRSAEFSKAITGSNDETPMSCGAHALTSPVSIPHRDCG